MESLTRHANRDITGCRAVTWLALVCASLVCAFGGAYAADEAAIERARASLARIETLRDERPGDGLLVFYQASVHASINESERAIDLLRSLKGRKLGLIPAPDGGFDPI